MLIQGVEQMWDMWDAVNDSQYHGGFHKTYFGRHALSDLAITRDLAVNREDKGRLSVLMLSCSTGQTVLDLLARLDAELNCEGRERMPIDVVAVDKSPAVINVAKAGCYPLNGFGFERGFRKLVPGSVPWFNVKGDTMIQVDWDAVRSAGHAIRYEVFDIDQGLRHLGVDRPFDLVEIRNSHHKTWRDDIENVSDVLSERGFVAPSSFTKNCNTDRFFGDSENVVRSVTNPIALRIQSGLIAPGDIRGTFNSNECLHPFAAALVFNTHNLLMGLGSHVQLDPQEDQLFDLLKRYSNSRAGLKTMPFHISCSLESMSFFDRKIYLRVMRALKRFRSL